MADDVTRAAQAAAIKTLIDAGYTSQSVTEAMARWPHFSALELFHRGLLSVQLHPDDDPPRLR